MRKILFVSLMILSFFKLSALQGSFIDIEGEVEVKLPGRAGFIPAAVGVPFPAGTVVCTGFDGTAEIDVRTAVITVGPLTRMTLEQLAVGAESAGTRLTLDSGSMRASVDSSRWSENDFEVSTPVTTASVRGTEFTITPRDLSCTEGQVSFTGSRGRAVSVSGGQAAQSGAHALRDPQSVEEMSISLTAASPMALAYGAVDPSAASVSSRAGQRDNAFLQDAIGGRVGSLTIEIE